MRSAAEAIALVPERSADPLDHVDYRLAETPEEKDAIYRLRYRAYLREGAILPSESQRVTDRYDDLPNSLDLRRLLHGELYSSIRISVLTSEWRGSPSSDVFADLLHPGSIRARSSSIRPASSPIPRRPSGFPNCPT